jgi:hypothetical protein
MDKSLHTKTNLVVRNPAKCLTLTISLILSKSGPIERRSVITHPDPTRLDRALLAGRHGRAVMMRLAGECGRSTRRSRRGRAGLSGVPTRAKWVGSSDTWIAAGTLRDGPDDISSAPREGAAPAGLPARALLATLPKRRGMTCDERRTRIAEVARRVLDLDGTQSWPRGNIRTDSPNI